MSEYKKEAECAISQIIKEDKQPIVVGGTGLYVNSLIYGIDYPEIETDMDYRKELEEIAEKSGLEELYKKACMIDEEAMKKISPNDRKRILRVLEIYKQTGKNKTEIEKESRKKGTKYDYKIFAIDIQRDLLYERINKRVDIMLEKGLVSEVKNLYKKYGLKMLTSMQAIGYKEVVQYINGECTEEQMIEKIKMETRRYAKRQLTWFKKIENIKWINGLDNTQNNIKIILEELK